jgi:hypothetical protein
MANNITPPQRAISRAFELGTQIVKAVDAREKIIESSEKIDPAFAMPAANWNSPANSFLKCYERIASLKWEEVQFLRIRAQNFSGNSLIAMREGRGLRGFDPISFGFEANWDDEKRENIIRHWKKLTKRLPPHLVLHAPNALGECGWWYKDILLNLDVVDYQERINLLDRSGLLDRFSNRAPRILEIGGGYGAICHALRKILRPSQYVICDLPESLLFSGLYMALASDAKVRLVTGSGDLTRTSRGEICLLPNYFAQPALSNQSFDIVINTLSMSEMSEHQVKTYGAIIAGAIGRPGVFFEQNHDNKHLGLIDCREYLAPFFKTKTIVEPGEMPSTRGMAVVWSNRP